MIVIIIKARNGWLHKVFRHGKHIQNAHFLVSGFLAGLAPVINDIARFMLSGICGVKEGPVMRLGMTVMRSMLFSSANFQAAFSASVLDAGYPCIFHIIQFNYVGLLYSIIKDNLALDAK